MELFTVNPEDIYSLTEKLTRAQLGLWLQIQAAVTSSGESGLISLKELWGQSIICHRDLPVITDVFCRQTDLIKALDKNREPLGDKFTNRQVVYIKLSNLKTKKKSKPKPTKVIELNPQQEAIKQAVMASFPMTKKHRINEAIVRWQSIYPNLNIIQQAKAAELWAFQKDRKISNSISFLGNWFKNHNTRFGTVETNRVNKGIDGVRKI